MRVWVVVLLSLPMVLPAQMSREERVSKSAESMREALVEQRRDFHMNPELSNREFRTAKVVADRLKALGFDEVKTGVAKTGVIGILSPAAWWLGARIWTRCP